MFPISTNGDNLGPRIGTKIKSKPDDVVRILRFPLGALRVIGQWPPVKDTAYKPVYHVFSFMMMTCVMLSFSFSENADFVALVLSHGDLNKITNNLTHCVSHTLGVYKSLNFFFKRDKVIRLIKLIEEDTRLFYEDLGEFQPRKMMKKAQNRNILAMASLACLASVFISFGILAPIFTNVQMYPAPWDNTTRLTDRPLPMSSWFPFDTRIEGNYWKAYFFQTVGLLHISFMILSLDNVCVGFFAQIQAQLEILNKAILTVEDRSTYYIKVLGKNKGGSVKDIDKAIEMEMLIQLKKCIRQHELIFELCDEINDTFNGVVFGQFVAGIVIISVTLFQCSTRAVMSLDFFYMSAFLVTMCFQLFIYCWFGNEVTLENAKLLSSTWHSGWLRCINRSGDAAREVAMEELISSFRLVRERAIKPFAFYAKGFSAVNLITFTRVLNAAYSYFAILKQINNK